MTASSTRSSSSLTGWKGWTVSARNISGKTCIFVFTTSICNELAKTGLNWKRSGLSKTNEGRRTAATGNVVHTSYSGAKCAMQKDRRCQFDVNVSGSIRLEWGKGAQLRQRTCPDGIGVSSKRLWHVRSEHCSLKSNFSRPKGYRFVSSTNATANQPTFHVYK